MKLSVIWILVGAVVVGWVWSAGQQAQGALKEQLAQNQQHIATLDSALKVERGKFTVDTVRTFRRITQTDTLIQTKLDTAILQHTDTVTITVKELAQIDTTIQACRATILDCGRLRALEQQRGDSLQVRVNLLQKDRPSAFGNLVRSVGWGLAGFGLGKIVR